MDGYGQWETQNRQKSSKTAAFEVVYERECMGKTDEMVAVEGFEPPTKGL